MSIVLFTLYLLLFTWLVTRIPFFKSSGLAPKWLALLFILKVAAACFYGYIHTLSEYYPAKIDTWRWYFDSLPETELLKTRPGEFFSSLFHDPYNGSTGKLFSSVNSFWNDLKNNFMIKLMALLNLLSGGRYYVNVIFYSFLAFYGPVALYRLFTNAFPHKKQIVLAGCFLLPSVVFWGSGFHKEGLLLSLLGLLLYAFYNSLRQHFTLKRVLGILLCTLFIFMLRNYLLFALAPALACWWLAAKKPRHTALIYTAGLAFFVLAFFMAGSMHPKLNLPATVSQKQVEFMALSGNTHIATDTLQPNAAGFLHNLPAALDMAFLRPRINEGGPTYLPSALETWGALLLLLLCLVYRQKNPAQKPLLWFCGSFAIILLLIVGYSVPVTGAVIRYRSLALPFLFLLLALQTNTDRLLKRFKLINSRK